MPKDYKKMYFELLEHLEEAAKLLSPSSINLPRAEKFQRKCALIKAVNDLFKK